MTHVLVTRLDGAGDVLLAGPAIRALRAGADRLSLVCGPGGAEAGGLLPGVDEVLLLDAPWVALEPSPFDRGALERFEDEVAARGVDRAFVLTSFHQSPLPMALVLRRAGVPWIGATSVDFPGALLDLRHHVDDDVHEVERSLSLAAAAGHRLPPGDDGRLAVALPGEPQALVDVVVHPGCSVPARTWAPERWRELVAALVVAGHRVGVTGGPAERALAAYVAEPGALDLAGERSLGELACLLAGAQVAVAGNTGPAHLAAAVGTPVVSLFPPTVPAVRWRPWGVPHVLLGDQGIACAGCRARACPFEGHPCLGSVPTFDALVAVEALAGAPLEVAR